jgi:hypothetical protein
LKKAIGVLIILLAIGIAVVPQLTKCHLATMTCNYTAKAEIALAIPIAIEGIVLLFVRKESTFGIAIMGAALGLAVILLATVLIGVCVSMIENMSCQTIMKPALIVFGVFLIIVNGWLLLISKSAKM